MLDLRRPDRGRRKPSCSWPSTTPCRSARSPSSRSPSRPGRDAEADVDRIVRALGLRIARGSGGISAVATLRRVYTRGGAAVLSRALRIIRDAYGEAGLEGPVIDGIGLLCQRYDGDLSEQRAIERLSSAHGGVSGLISRAGQLRQSTGSATAQCVAAAAVEVINRGSGGRKLPGWWRNDQ